MKAPLHTAPRGVMHVPVTPFNGDMSVDYVTFEKLVDWHVRQKPSSLCVVLHIAESVSLTMDEHKRLIEISVKVTAGRVPVIATVLVEAVPYIQSGKLRAIASTSPKRAPSLPDVPTAKESGLPDYVVTSWNAISGPAGIPDPVVRLLSREIVAALKLPDVQEKALQFGLDARGTTPEEMRERMVADIAKWSAVIDKAGLERQ